MTDLNPATGLMDTTDFVHESAPAHTEDDSPEMEEGEVPDNQDLTPFDSGAPDFPTQPTYTVPYSFTYPPAAFRSTKDAFCDPVSLFKPSISARTGSKELEEVNFFKGCEWSPDGTCLLTSSNDDTLRIFEVPHLDAAEATFSPVLTIPEGEPIYDFAWFPLMSSAGAPSVKTCRSYDMLLFDDDSRPSSSDMRCCYPAFDHLDQILAPLSVSFNLDGSKIYGTFNSLVQIFDTSRPGHAATRRPTSPNRRSKEGQKGLLTSITFNPDHSGMYAVGSYGKTVGLYDERNDEMLYCFGVPGGGVTQTQFSSDGKYLYTASRRSNAIQSWDIRNTGEVLFEVERKGDTNQRLAFDVESGGRWLVSGDTDGYVTVHDVREQTAEGEDRVVRRWEGHKDTISSAQFHPYYPYIATCSGQRRKCVKGEKLESREGVGGEVECVMVDVDGVEVVVESWVKIWRVGIEGEGGDVGWRLMGVSRNDQFK
ncbi:Telomerase Cajal body protein 1 [Rhizophlyctis rosea]|nr:Telomerase Cajal body protein 1 [Rhizophlyctis rosea]